MKYRIFFVNSEHIEISEKDFTLLQEVVKIAKEVSYVITENKSIIALQYITHITPFASLEQASGVITPPKPEDIEQQRQKEREEKISNPSAIIEGVKEKQDA